MTKHERYGDDRNERLSPALYHELAKHGWRLPQSDQEVRAAEESIAKSPIKLPERLRDLPEDGRSRTPGGLLERYLRDAERDGRADDARSRDDNKSDRDLDR
jgi:hypothetical protein